MFGPCECDAQGIGGVVTHAYAMTEEIMERTVKKHVEAALFAKSCGFGMITIHGGHGWLLHQFMSPAINHRTDEPGGSFENRMRFPLRVMKAVREAVRARISPSRYVYPARRFMRVDTVLSTVWRLQRRWTGWLT